MSSAIFFHSLNEINLKLWLAAVFSTAALASYAAISQPDAVKVMAALLSEGNKAETSGQYRQARSDFDLVLLEARTQPDKKLLISALLKCARMDHEFGEDKLACALAQEAVSLSRKAYGPQSRPTAEAMLGLADVVEDNEQAMLFYRNALQIFKQDSANSQELIARTLRELSFCYDSAGLPGRANSAIKAALAILAGNNLTAAAEYARCLVQYANLADLENKDKLAIYGSALQIQEKALGNKHPELSSTLRFIAANLTDNGRKEKVLKQAIEIEESAFGPGSLRLAQGLTALADVYQSSGHKAEAKKLRLRAAEIIHSNKLSLEAMSIDFARSYSSLLHELHFDKESRRLDGLLQQRQTENSSHSSHGAIKENADSENDPEYWRRTEEVPIAQVSKFSSGDLDYLQLWYEHGSLRLEAFSAGELVWKKNFGECPTGILNASADKDRLTVSWRDGDGPVWHKDVYQVNSKAINLVSSATSDAYAEQIEQQVVDVINGDADAVNEGAVESVPSSYINNNFLSDAIRRGEHKALQLYGSGEAAEAAEVLGRVFDLTAKAIDAQSAGRPGENPAEPLKREQRWLNAWRAWRLPVADYITALNDYGFFLQQSGSLRSSADVLQMAAKVAPGRALAYLNLADSYWKLGNASEARKNYRTYLSLMRKQNGLENIPARVYQRTCGRNDTARSCTRVSSAQSGYMTM